MVSLGLSFPNLQQPNPKHLTLALLPGSVKVMAPSTNTRVTHTWEQRHLCLSSGSCLLVSWLSPPSLSTLAVNGDKLWHL